MNKIYLFGIAICLIAAVIWGTGFPITAKALAYMDAFSITTLRFTMAAITLVIVLFIIEGKKAFKLNLTQFLGLLLLGTLGFLGAAFLSAYGLSLIGSEGSLNVAVITATGPLMSLIILSVIKKTKPSFLAVTCIVVSLFGILLVITKGNIIKFFDISSHPFANLLILLGALFFIIYSLGGTMFKNFSAIAYTTLTTVFGSLFLLVVSIGLFIVNVVELPSVTSLKQTIPYLLHLSVIASAMTLVLWNYGNKTISPINGVLFLNLTPIASIVLSMFFHIFLSVIQIIGMSITIVALVINNVGQRKQVLPK